MALPLFVILEQSNHAKRLHYKALGGAVRVRNIPFVIHFPCYRVNAGKLNEPKQFPVRTSFRRPTACPKENLGRVDKLNQMNLILAGTRANA